MEQNSHDGSTTDHVHLLAALHLASPAHTKLWVLPHTPLHDFSQVLEGLAVLLELEAAQSNVVLQLGLCNSTTTCTHMVKTPASVTC